MQTSADTPSSLLLEAVNATTSVLSTSPADAWRHTAGPVEWNCSETVAHVASGLFWYAGQLATERTDGFLAFETVLEHPSDTEELVALVHAGGTVLARTVAATSEHARAFHFFGISDAPGFAAMGIVETLVHGHDVALGLGVTLSLPERPCRYALDRLFPEPPDGPAPDVLLWCTGRAPLFGVPAPATWRWDASVRP
jgi:Mycothiol maleylpyruvate isomerase N-terminal domain